MFTQVSLPTPFQVGPVNAYLAGRTIVDPGPDSEEAWARLVEALDARELQPDDLAQVVVTHPHPDHFGMANRLRELGADVIASADAAAVMADFEGRLDAEQSYFSDFFERCGMSGETARTVTELPDAFVTYAPSVETDREVTDGDQLAVADEPLHVTETTGHAVGELVLSFEGSAGQSAIVGDHVLPDITPNPFLQPPPEEGAGRPRVLPAYNDSLAALRDADYDRFLPGHREVIEHPTGRIGAILEAHRERTETVHALVEGPTTPVEVMESLFGDLPVTEYFSGMSEAVGHLDVLESQGRVRPREEGGLVVYERTD